MWVDGGEQARPSAVSWQTSSGLGAEGTVKGDSEKGGVAEAGTCSVRLPHLPTSLRQVEHSCLQAGSWGSWSWTLLPAYLAAPPSPPHPGESVEGEGWEVDISEVPPEILKGLGLLLGPQRLGPCLGMGKGWASSWTGLVDPSSLVPWLPPLLRHREDPSFAGCWEKMGVEAWVSMAS